ncbi:MAG: ECF transporter S component [Candidatus Bathyarchaeota archaeon]|nr:ECF transporter S component [Candidatus Bathyarchaeota archaeon]
MKHLSSKNIALTAVFASLYYVMSYLPGIPAIGVPGVRIQLEACMASVFGLILGPYLGALATFLGVLVAWALPPGSMSPQSLIFLPSPIINALIVGFIYGGRWKIATMILAALVAAFWFLPPAQPLEQNFVVGIAAMWDKLLALFLVAPSVILMRKLGRSAYHGALPLDKEVVGDAGRRISWLSITVLLSAILILVNAHMIAASGDALRLQYYFQGETYKITLGYKSIIRSMALYGYLWYLVGIGMLASALMLQIKPKYSPLWGGVAVALSGISTVIGGGFIIGFILGAVGGLLILVKAQTARIQVPKMLNINFLVYFFLAFIGNEADNAWGNNIFAVPQVYEGLFGLTLEAVRWAFLISPYAYFIIRLIQAAIAALIALPLIHNLKAAEFGLLHQPKK